MSQTYSESRRDGKVPVQYSEQYQRLILTKGLDMNVFRGKELISKLSLKLCEDLLTITSEAIRPTIFAVSDIQQVIDDCRFQNEAFVSRDITPLITPTITSLRYKEGINFKSALDKVNAAWCDKCVLIGPRP
jgi:hypothetical protein